MKNSLVLILFISIIFTSNSFCENKLPLFKKQHEQALALLDSKEPADREEGISLLKTSIEKGYWRSAYIIGCMKMSIKNKEHAYFWFNLAKELTLSPFAPKLYASYDEAFEFYKKVILKDKEIECFRSEDINLIIECQKLINDDIKYELDQLTIKIQQLERFMDEEEKNKIQSAVVEWLKKFRFI